MKHFLIIIRALLLCMALVLPGMLRAASARVDVAPLRYTVDTEAMTAEVYGLVNSSAELQNLVIPDHIEYNGTQVPVSSIGYEAFYGCSGLTSVTIPNSVTSIDSSAFEGCSGLTSVTIPNSVTSIGYEAFYGCSGLTSVTIPNSVTSIGSYAFKSCSGIKEVTIADGESTLDFGVKVFYGVGFTKLYLGRSFTYSGYYSSDAPFYSKKSLTELTIGNSVTTIGSSAFYECSGLTSVTIPNSVTSIGSSAFDGCSGLTSVSIPNSVTSIGSSAFDGCSGLTSVSIPNSVTSIGDYAFYNCSGIKEVTIADGESTLNFGAKVFSGVGFAKLYLGRNFTYSGSSSSSSSSSYAPFYSKESLTELTIGNSVTSIGDYAFYNCSGIKEVTIADGESTLDFGYDVFYGVGFTKLYLGRNFTYDGSSSYTPFYSKGSLTELTIGNSVTSIGNKAFSGCSGLTSVTIGNSVTSIGSYAFNGCSGLTSVTIPNSVTSIGSSAFYGCSDLTSVTFGKSVTSIGYDAFCGCSGLTSVTIPNSVTSIGSSAFYGCSGLASVTIGNSVTSIGDYAFYNCNGLTSVTIGNSVTSIDSYAFSRCSGLTSVTIPNSVTSIGSSAFSGCSGLTSVTIGNSVTSIGSYAFEGCSGIKEVTFADGESTLDFGYDVFSGAELAKLYLGRNFLYSSSSSSGAPFSSKESLTELIIGNSVTSIGSSAFFGCSGLTKVEFASIESLCKIEFGNSSANPLYYTHRLWIAGEEVKNVVIPNSVTKIGSYTFSECSGLTSVTIPNSVTSIGYEAFYGCSGIKEITIADSESILYLGDDVFYEVNPTKLYLGRNFTYDGSSSYAPFYSKESLTELTLGPSINSISEHAFVNANINKLISKAEIAPDIDINSFSPQTRCMCNVEIPESSLPSYQQKWACFNCFADITNDRDIIKVSSPGNLINQIAIDKVNEITKLKLIGKINGTDLLTLNKCPNIISLDLSEATIVSGGMPYYDKDNQRFGTEDDTLGEMWSYNMPLLSTIKIPLNLKVIKDFAFSGKTNLLSIEIPNSVTSIGVFAFEDCSGLKEITIADGESPLYFGWNVFSGVELNKLYLGRSFTYEGSSSSSLHAPFDSMESLTELTIGNSVTSIPCYAFEDCSGLNKVEFASIESLCKIEFGSPTANPLYYAHNLWIAGKEVSDVVIPSSVTSIGDYAFYNCSGLTSVTIPNSVTSIGDYAFYNCSVTSVTIPNSVTSICKYTFYGCSGLTSVTIPNSVTSIGSSAFEGCSGLTSVTIGNSVTSIGNKAFYGCSGLASVTIPNSVISIGYFAFSGCSGLTAVTIGNSVTSIEEAAFSLCSSLTSVVIGNSVTSIGSSAFEGCTNLTSLNIPDPVQKIGEEAFYDCNALKTLILPGSLREISYDAFSGCSSLESVKVINPIPPVIEGDTFSNMANADLTVPDGSRNIYWIHPYWGRFKSVGVWGGEDDVTFIADNVTYRVTSEADHTVEVTAVNLTARKAELEIPAEVELDGQSYRVAGISNNGFENVSIASVALPATIGYVGLEAFKGCKTLREVDCKAVTPPSVYGNSFDEATYSAATLKVPKESIEAYEENDVWGKFSIATLFIPIERIELNPDKWEGSHGETFNIVATIYPANASKKKLEWTSSNKNIATVDSEGYVTVLKAGSCEITATATDGSAVTAKCSINATTGIDDVTAESNDPIVVYNLNGVLIMETTDKDRIKSLAPAIYILRQGNSMKKIVVK